MALQFDIQARSDRSRPILPISSSALRDAGPRANRTPRPDRPAHADKTDRPAANSPVRPSVTCRQLPRLVEDRGNCSAHQVRSISVSFWAVAQQGGNSRVRSPAGRADSAQSWHPMMGLHPSRTGRDRGIRAQGKHCCLYRHPQAQAIRTAGTKTVAVLQPATAPFQQRNTSV